MIAALVAFSGAAARAADDDTPVAVLIGDAVAEYDAGHFQEARALFRQAHDKVPTLFAQARDGARTGEVGAELLRLYDRSLGEVAARDTGREPEVVLDTRAGPCLASDGGQFDDQGSQSLRGAIDSRC